MDIKQKSYLSLHFAVFLFGFTGILGAVIDLPAITLVWWRALITWIGLIPILYLTKELKLPSRKDFLTFFFIGILVAIHWICFYGAIKLSNSSVAMICLATIPVFTTICETLINKNKWNRSDIFIGIAIIPGMLLIVQNISIQFQLGFLVGIIASIFSAIFATLNKKHITKGTSMQITWIELFSVWCFISLFLPFYHYYNPTVAFLPSGDDWIYLILLSVFCTIVAFVLVVKSLQHLSAFSAMLCFNLEPVYGILFAAIFLQDYKNLNVSFYLGVIVIVSTVIYYPFYNKSKSKLVETQVS